MSLKRVLILGDIVGQPGLRALFFHLPSLIKTHKADYVIVNAENAADGFGLFPEQADKLFSQGVDVITTGNHIWQRKEIIPMLNEKRNLLRPDNYSSEVPGHGVFIGKAGDARIAVINLQGLVRMPANIDNPFIVIKSLLKKVTLEADLIFVDFHAEEPQEKEALALYLDGKVTSVTGTHTHIQTGDERIFPGGTAYMTDIGMCGPDDSVIGTEPELSIRRAATQLPLKMEIKDGPVIISGCLITADSETGKAVDITRIKA